jgi:hypothetical protein
MSVIKIKTKLKNAERWANLNNVNIISKSRDLSTDSWDVTFEFGIAGHNEEYDTEAERDARFEEVFAKWSGKTYLKEVK